MNILTSFFRLSSRVTTMSVAASVQQLSSPIKELVTSASKNGEELVGKSDKDASEISAWIDKVSDGTISKDLKTLDAELTSKTYLVGSSLSAADVALYGVLHPVVSKLPAAQCYSHPAVTRYFDHVQTAHEVRQASSGLSSDFPVVNFDLDAAPKLERRPDPPKEKKKAKAVANDESGAKAESSKVAEKSVKTEDKPTQKKEKKKESASTVKGQEEAPGKKKTPAKAAPADDGPPEPSMIDLRVGHIIDVQKHPDADSLYVEQIDIGEETGPRTVVSGLVKYIPIEEMRDKYLVAVCNLKPASMRGVKSFAMVLCATSKDGKDGGIEIIKPPANSKPGDRIFFEGFEGKEPLSQLNPKKKIFETIQPNFVTLDSKEAAWINPETKSVHKIRTSEGICVAPSLIGASLS